MSPTRMHVAVVALAMAALTGAARAEESAKYLQTELSVYGDRAVLARSAVEINGQPHRWYRFEFRMWDLDGSPVKTTEGKPYIREWSNLFYPDTRQTVRWADQRQTLNFADLEKQIALPKGTTFTWAVGGVAWSFADKKILGDPWHGRSYLMLTTDKAGRIVAADVFNRPAFQLHPDGGGKAQYRKVDLKLAHLKLADGVGMFSRTDDRSNTWFLLYDGKRRCFHFETESRGAFFGPIDSADKARELATLDLGGAVVIETPKQYAAIVAAAKSKGYKAGQRGLLADQPRWYGLEATEVPKLGWRVRGLIVVRWNDWLREVKEVRWDISPDGRMAYRQKMLVEPPQIEASQPAGWVQPLPTDAPTYHQALTDALAGLKPVELPRRLKPTDQTVRMPTGAGEMSGWWHDEE